jgi:hypothetical protein
MPADTVLVHIETSDDDVRLVRVDGSSNGECRAPCDVPVSRASDRFFVTGASILPSSQFVLADHAKRNRVALKVKGGGVGPYVAGGLLGTASAASLFLAIGFGVSSSGDKGTVVGLCLGIGIAAGIGAVIAFATGGTSVTFPED